MVLSRRGFLQAGAAVGAATLLPGWGRIGAARADDSARAFRLAHVTDVHMRPDRGAVRGFAKCLAGVHELKPRPDLIVTGGDLVHDARNDTPAGAKRKFALARDVLKDSDIPTRHCIGNHDCLGWGPKSEIADDHPDYGKKLFRDEVGIDELTYAFDAGGWRIVVVDNIQPTNFDGVRGYQGRFDEPVLDWLDEQFTAAGDRPKLLVTHIPITSTAVLGYTKDTTEQNRDLPTSLVCTNAWAILKLLDRHRVNLVLTGHLHQSERSRYQHTTHVGQGAVSGQWWGGANRGTEEGFGIVDLHPDGTFTHDYIDYGWAAER